MPKILIFKIFALITCLRFFGGDSNNVFNNMTGSTGIAGREQNRDSC